MTLADEKLRRLHTDLYCVMRSGAAFLRRRSNTSSVTSRPRHTRNIERRRGRAEQYPRCLRKSPRVSPAFTMILVCSDWFVQTVTLLIGSAAVKSQMPSIGAGYIQTVHHRRLLKSIVHPSVKHSPVVIETIYIHVFCPAISVKNIHVSPFCFPT